MTRDLASTTTPLLAALMERLDGAQAPFSTLSTAEPDVLPASASFEATLIRAADGWAAKFALASHGVVKPVESVEALLEKLHERDAVNLGRGVEVRLEPLAFDARSREVLEFLEGLVTRRQAIGVFATAGQAARATAAAATAAAPDTPCAPDASAAPAQQAVLPLTLEDTVELLDIHGEFDAGITVEDGLGGRAFTARVLREDPDVHVIVEAAGDAATPDWTIRTRKPLPVIHTDTRLYIWRDDTFYQCSHGFAELAGFLELLATGQTMTLAAADVPLFCRTLLPALERHADVSMPPELLAAYLGSAQSATEDAFAQLIDHFSNAAHTEYASPATLRAALRPYQLEGFQWLSMLCDMGCGGILADEMGLGKTVQVIALLCARQQEIREQGPALVICPSSLVYNWAAELAKFAPALTVELLAGSKEERARHRGRRADVFVTSYDLARIDCDELAALRPDLLILDEAHYIKSPGAKTTRAIKRIPTRHAFALTGTPVENDPAELWSLFDFVMPDYLGTYRRFRKTFEAGLLRGDTEVVEHLHNLVSPFLLRRLKEDVLAHLPEKLESVVPTSMAPEQRALYDQRASRLREELEGKGAEEGDANTSRAPKAKAAEKDVLAEITRLRQLCDDPALVDPAYEGGAPKVDAIVELAANAARGGEKSLVFSQFTSFLARIAHSLEEAGLPYYLLEGDTPKRERQRMADAFNADDTPVFLISLMAGGTGLTLTGASVVIHADPWWNAAAEDQATDRAHRIGQDRDVKVYKVIAQDSIEEKIVQLQEKKARLSDELVKAEGDALSGLAEDDLLALLQDSSGSAHA